MADATICAAKTGGHSVDVRCFLVGFERKGLVQEKSFSRDCFGIGHLSSGS